MSSKYARAVGRFFVSAAEPRISSPAGLMLESPARRSSTPSARNVSSTTEISDQPSGRGCRTARDLKVDRGAAGLAVSRVTVTASFLREQKETARSPAGDHAASGSQGIG